VGVAGSIMQLLQVQRPQGPLFGTVSPATQE
jgi:hypothetical protein